MTRLYGRSRHDDVEVRRRDEAPEQFLWRGRLYVVRAVLSRWTESGRWWHSPEVRGLTAGASLSAGALSAGALSAAPATIDDGECDWWRVEADSGRLAALSAGTGVYDLCFAWSRGAWSLARVLD